MLSGKSSGLSIKKKTYIKKLALDNNIRKRWQQAQVLLLGGSAGSFKLLFRMVKQLPERFNKTVIIVIHRKKNFFSEIEKLFAENSRMLLREVSDKEPIRQNTIYIAPANYHTLVEEEGFFSLDVSEAVWYSKPSIDVTFESVADVYNKSAAAILLSGANQDGAEGLLKLRQSGALTIAQDPADAEMAEMPQSAIDIQAAEYVLTTKEIFELLEDTT
ncbi:chemotaxis protein CheB [Mucilaginibacter litoreus]|uniref:chemotaxis protein CheB n=1 Tax=Mucilaginibacter litoreus TaxID=1048221 RepID=UPI00366D8CA2